MRKVWAILIITLLVILQTVPQFKVFGFFPDLLLILVVYYSFKVGTTQGIIFGAILGVFVDILSGSYIGTRSLVFATVAMSIEFFRTIFIFEMLMTVPLVSFFTTIIKYFILFILYILFRSVSIGEWYIYMLVEGVLNFIFAFPMMWLSNKIISLLHREFYFSI